MTLSKTIAQFWHDLRNPEPPAKPVIDPELMKRAKRVGRSLGQLHSLGISDADIRSLSSLALEQRVACLETQMHEQGICEPRTVFVEPAPKVKQQVHLLDTDSDVAFTIEGR